ncbi:ion channel protein [Curtobacterium sp. ZW137]|uniref:ion channel protein n=1 Tax=Curtobacterium sp. ZW137 TaxID=2485104 RepID=UPI000F4AF9C1|nr:ion channel protein [Curtobacterium sp. ZW137]ROP64857.1 H+/Cl- antiporter ClcA [Curtobacterium sp. ZW137]
MTVRELLRMSVPALVIGVVAALVLFVVEAAGAALETLLWDALPGVLHVDGSSGWWIVLVLTATGAGVGVVLRFAPGHGGRDSATTELIAPPLDVKTLPSLAGATVLGLGGGVSLGPENPVIAMTTSLLVSAGRVLRSRMRPETIVALAAAATIGALFGTPVAAALVFTGMAGGPSDRLALWDRLFLPLVAAGAAAVTMTFLAHPAFVVDLPTYTTPSVGDLGSAAVVASAGACLGVAMAWVFPALHRFVHRMPGPVVAVTVAGAGLGLLGAVGGPVTLFNGADEIDELVSDRAHLSATVLALVIAVKCLALLLAAASGFRGGRIFPAVFIGAALGLLAHELVPAVPLTVAIASGVVGVVLAVARDGWIALFIGATITGSVPVLAVLCVAILPAWLIVSRAPEFIAVPSAPAVPVPRSGARW